MTEQNERTKKPLYYYSAAYARDHGELDQYRASLRANIACREAIETAIAENYRNNSLNVDAVRQVVSGFGYERVFYVLACTVREKDWDARFSHENKEWARSVYIGESESGQNYRFVVDRSHPGLVDLFLTQARREFAKEQEKKSSVRKSMKQNTAQTTTGHRLAQRKEPER